MTMQVVPGRPLKDISLPSVSTTQGGSVTMPNGSWADILSIVLEPGIWVVTGAMSWVTGSAGNGYGRLFDGVETYCEVAVSSQSASFFGCGNFISIVTVTKRTTLRMQGQTNGTGTWYVAGDVATSTRGNHMFAWRVA